MNKSNSASVESVDKVICCAVCFGTIITFVACIGHMNSFGIIYNDFIQETHSSAKSMTTALGVFGIMLAIGGIILNILSKRISLRLGGIIGAITVITGSFSTIFISNMNQLPFTFGVLQGIGFGMMVPVCYSTLNHYFVKKRTTVMSICKAIQGLLVIFYPQLLKVIKFTYGFRGTLIILSGITLHTIPGMLIMKADDKKQTTKIKTANDVESRKGHHENVDLLKADGNLLKDDKNKNNDVESQKGHHENVDLLKADGNANEISYKEIEGKNKIGVKIRKLGYELLNILNVRVLKDPIFCNICLGQSFVNFSDLTFFILHPMLLYQYGYDTTQVAMCISVGAGADVAGRCALAMISGIVSVNTRLLYYAATALTLLFRIVLLLLQVRQFIWICTVTAALGVLRSWLHVASPVVIADHVTHEDFPGAYAVFMLSAGLVNVMFSPLIGSLKDVYLDYVPAFHALSACCLPCLVLWPLEYIWLKKSGDDH